MKLVIKDKSKKEQFIALFGLLKKCCEKLHIYFRSDSMYLQGTDKSHVFLFNLEIDYSWFFEYKDIQDDQDNDPDPICVNSNVFHKIISSVSKSNSIIIIFDEEKPDFLYIDHVLLDEKPEPEQETKKGKKTKEIEKNDKHFTIPLISDNEYNVIKLPENIEYDVEFIVNSKEIIETSKIMSNFEGDIITFVCNNETGVKVTTTGKQGEMSVPLQLEGSESIKKNVELSYSLTHFLKMMSSKIDEKIHVSLNEQTPMKLSYNLGDNSKFEFYIATKLKELV